MPPDDTERYAWSRSFMLAGLIAAAFGLAAVGLLAANYLQNDPYDPLNCPQLAELKQELAASPTDEDLKRRIRDLDLELRNEFFRRLAYYRVGRLILLGGIAMSLLALKSAMEIRKKPHRPPRAGITLGAGEYRRKTFARVAVGALAAGLFVPAFTLMLGPDKEKRGAAVTAEPSKYPTPDEIARNWPGFRGPNGSGVYAAEPVPTSWNGRTGERILWKTEVPVPGASSPAVWKDRVFLTAADKETRLVYCFNADTGALIWTTKVGEASPAGPEDIWNEFCYAASTPVTDGRWICTVFANGDVACLDFDGRRIWQANLGTPDNEYGHASSPVLHRNLLIIQYDQGGEDEGKSRLLALDVTSGHIVWEAKRPVGQSWASPLVIDAAGRTVVVCCSIPWVIAHDIESGVGVWKAKTLEYGYHGVPSPVFAGGLIFAVDEGALLAAIKVDGKGDVSDTHVVWKTEEDLPAVCSPATDGELLFTLTSGGRLCCYEAVSGKSIWQHDVEEGGAYEASPCIAGGRLYFTNDSGVTFIVAAEREFEKAGRGELGEAFKGAGPAFRNGRIYIRGVKHLFCIGEK